MQADLRLNVDDTIDKAWPLLRDGIIPTDGTQLVNAFQALVGAYEPQPGKDELIRRDETAPFERAQGSNGCLFVYSVQSTGCARPDDRPAGLGEGQSRCHQLCAGRLRL